MTFPSRRTKEDFGDERPHHLGGRPDRRTADGAEHFLKKRYKNLPFLKRREEKEMPLTREERSLPHGNEETALGRQRIGLQDGSRFLTGSENPGFQVFFPRVRFLPEIRNAR